MAEIVKRPSLDAWLDEAYECDTTGKTGMYLFHNGIVRKIAKAEARNGILSESVKQMNLSVDHGKVSEVIEASRKLKGITYIKVWIQEGLINQGESIMLVLIGGDIRPNVVNGLEYLIGRLKNECITENEIFA